MIDMEPIGEFKMKFEHGKYLTLSLMHIRNMSGDINKSIEGFYEDERKKWELAPLRKFETLDLNWMGIYSANDVYNAAAYRLMEYRVIHLKQLIEAYCSSHFSSLKECYDDLMKQCSEVKLPFEDGKMHNVFDILRDSRNYFAHNKNSFKAHTPGFDPELLSKSVCTFNNGRDVKRFAFGRDNNESMRENRGTPLYTNYWNVLEDECYQAIVMYDHMRETEETVKDCIENNYWRPYEIY